MVIEKKSDLSIKVAKMCLLNCKFKRSDFHVGFTTDSRCLSNCICSGFHLFAIRFSFVTLSISFVSHVSIRKKQNT